MVRLPLRIAICDNDSVWRTIMIKSIASLKKEFSMEIDEFDDIDEFLHYSIYDKTYDLLIIDPIVCVLKVDEELEFFVIEDRPKIVFIQQSRIMLHLLSE